MMKHPWRLLSLGVLAALVGWPGLVAAQPVKAGAVVPLTGRYGAGGAQVRPGYDIAVALSKPPATKEYTVDLLNSIPAGDRPKAAAIFQEKADWGRQRATAWAEAATQAGYQVAMVGEYAPGAKDFSDLILKAKGAGADLVLGLPTPPDGMTIVKQMKELGLNPKMTLLIRAPDPPIWSKNLGKDGDYVVLAPGWHHGVKAPAVTELNEAHMKKIGRPADPIAGPAYACVQILAAALGRAGSLDRDKIPDAIAATDMTTVIGPVKFRPDGTGIVNAVFVQWLSGKQELVFPKDAATAPLGYPAPPFAKS